MDLELYKILKNLEKDFNDKYNVKSLCFTPDNIDFNNIIIEIKNTEAINSNIQMLKIIDELICELNKKGYSYNQSKTNTSSMQVSDGISGKGIVNETTKNIYRINKI